MSRIEVLIIILLFVTTDIMQAKHSDVVHHIYRKANFERNLYDSRGHKYSIYRQVDENNRLVFACKSKGHKFMFPDGFVFEIIDDLFIVGKISYDCTNFGAVSLKGNKLIDMLYYDILPSQNGKIPCVYYANMYDEHLMVDIYSRNPLKYENRITFELSPLNVYFTSPLEQYPIFYHDIEEIREEYGDSISACFLMGLFNSIRLKLDDALCYFKRVLEYDSFNDESMDTINSIRAAANKNIILINSYLSSDDSSSK